jgi:hypothetical protein
MTVTIIDNPGKDLSSMPDYIQYVVGLFKEPNVCKIDIYLSHDGNYVISIYTQTNVLTLPFFRLPIAPFYVIGKSRQDEFGVTLMFQKSKELRTWKPQK